MRGKEHLFRGAWTILSTCMNPKSRAATGSGWGAGLDTPGTNRTENHLAERVYVVAVVRRFI